MLFTKLALLLEQHEGWSALCLCTDLHAIAEQCCETPALYEATFKALRSKRRDAEKIPDSIKIDCICVSLSPLKSTLDENFRSIHEALLLVLKRTITENVHEVIREFPFRELVHHNF